MKLLTCPICGSLRSQPTEFSCRTPVPGNPETLPVPSERCRALAYYRLVAIRARGLRLGDATSATLGHGTGHRVDLLVPRLDDLGLDAVSAFVYPTGLIDVPELATCGKDPESLWGAVVDGHFVCSAASLPEEIADVLRSAS